jgi:hypothetical protein
MLKPEVVEHLSHNRDFALLLQELYALREELIAQLRDCPTERLQHLAGRISELDDVLALCAADSVLDRWASLNDAA